LRKAREFEPDLIVEALRRIQANDFSLTPQDEAAATTFPHLRTPKDSELDPAKPLLDLFNAIRACDPRDYPAFFYVDGEKVCVKLWRPAKPAGEDDLI
jgi:methionyl-tRNA formyltransferase